MDSNQVEFCAEIKWDTDDAILAYDGANEIWLPKSQIDIRVIKHPDVEITLPEWLAKVKGII